MNLKSFLIILALSIAIAGCSSSSEGTTDPTPLSSTRAPLESPTTTPTAPHSTATLQPPAPLHPTITQPPSPLPPPPTDAIYTLPGWVSSPTENLLMTVTGGYNESEYFLTFFDAETEERFDLQFDNEICAYFWWPDRQHFGLLTKNFETIYRVSLSDGRIEAIQPSEQNLRFLDTNFFPDSYPPAPLIALSPVPGPDDFFLIHAQDRWKASNDGRYIIPNPVLDPDPFTTVEDLVTDKTFQISYPEFPPEYLENLKKNGASIAVDIAWSSVAPLVSIRGGKFRIYDSSSGNLVGVYQNVGDEYPYGPDFQKGVRWSPDGTKLLYSRGEDHYSDTPCIFFLETGETQCLDSLRLNYGHQYVSHYNWTADGRGLNYTYYTENSGGQGELCQVDLSTKNTTCPTDGIQELTGHYVINYSYSPNSRFVALTADTSCPMCDFYVNPMLSILAADGSSYTSLGNTISDSWDDGFLWWKP